MANRKPVKRITKHFQLRVEHPQDKHVIEVLDYAKSQRREVTVIREAISLYYALEQGNLDALFEKFPQYKSIKDGSGGAGELDEIKRMLELLIAQRKSADSGYTMQSLQPTTGKQLAAPVIAMPSFEDDDMPTLLLKKNDKCDAGMNFLASIGGVQ